MVQGLVVIACACGCVRGCFVGLGLRVVQVGLVRAAEVGSCWPVCARVSVRLAHNLGLLAPCGGLG